MTEGKIRGFALAVVLTVGSVFAYGGDPLAEFKTRIDSLTINPIEGIWKMTPGGGETMFAVCAKPGSESEFDIIIIESPDWRIKSGTKCGKLWVAARKGVYDCMMLSNPSKPMSYGKYTATVELDDQGRRLIFKPYKKKRSISLKRWLPYFFRISITEEDTRPKDLDGAYRIYPPQPGVMPVKL